MKRLARFFARLYPAPWRARYGDEFDALLDDSKPGVREAFDISMGAITTQVTNWSFGRITLVGFLAGAACALAFAFSIPNRWESEALLVATADRDPVQFAKYMTRLQDFVLGDSTLLHLIQTNGLYPEQRHRQPAVEIVDNMRHHLRIELVQRAPGVAFDSGVIPFRISFDYPDRAAAQRVVQAVAWDYTHRGTGPGLPATPVELLDGARWPASPIGPPRGEILGGGTAFGLLSGIASAIYLRRRNSHPCPTCGQRVATPTPPQVLEPQS